VVNSKPLAYRLYRQFWLGVDLLFPPRCVGCGRVGARFCDDCLAAAPHVSQPVCARCGNPLPPRESLCPQCRLHPPAFAAARAWALMEGSARQAVHRLKYRRDLALADVLAAQLLALVQSLGWPVETVVAVPLGKQRQKARGYNQAALLAFPLALGLGVPWARHALARVRETRSQVGLDIAARRRNVARAFQAMDAAAVRGKTVLLVDDVMTTGATLDASARALLHGGAAQVYAVTVARAFLRTSVRW